MRLVFCGTPEFAVPTLEALIGAGHELALVVTQPDRPSGRGLQLSASPVKQCAQRHRLRIEQPEKIKKNDAFRALLQEIAADAIIVVGYGRLIPPWMLEMPRYGNINLHGSLLPKYRGAAPIQWAIAEGEIVTGVTTMRLDEGLDTGDILLQRETKIGEDETAPVLGARLATIGAELMVATLSGLHSGSIVRQPQDNRHASLAPILKKEDGLANFTFPASQIYNRLRGFQPWPGCYTTFRGRKLAIADARAIDHGAQPPSAVSFSPITGEGAFVAKNEPGTLILDGKRISVACAGNSALELIEVQPEGKKRMAATDFIHGYRPQPGEKLGA